MFCKVPFKIFFTKPFVFEKLFWVMFSTKNPLYVSTTSFAFYKIIYERFCSKIKSKVSWYDKHHGLCELFYDFTKLSSLIFYDILYGSSLQTFEPIVSNSNKKWIQALPTLFGVLTCDYAHIHQIRYLSICTSFNFSQKVSSLVLSKFKKHQHACHQCILSGLHNTNVKISKPKSKH